MANDKPGWRSFRVIFPGNCVGERRKSRMCVCVCQYNWVSFCLPCFCGRTFHIMHAWNGKPIIEPGGKGNEARWKGKQSTVKRKTDRGGSENLMHQPII